MKKNLSRITPFLSFFILALFSSATSYSTNYYISNSGNDYADGKSPNSAWKTIDKYNSSRSLIVAGDSILFKRGDVFIGKVIHKSGTAGSNVVYGAYGTGSKPVITGSEPITNWTGKGNDVYTVTANKLYTHLFVNNNQITIARFPNKSYTPISGVSGNTVQNSSINLAGVNWKGATFHYRRQYDMLTKGTVTEHSGTSLTVDAAVNTLLVGNGFYLDNHLAALDIPYEWFQDKSTKLITLKLPAGITPAGLKIEGSYVDLGLSLNWGGQYIVIQDLDFRNFTQMGIIGSQAKFVKITRNDFRFINVNCIKLEGTSSTDRAIDNVVDRNNFYDCNGASISMNNCANIMVTNNLVKRNAMIAGYEGAVINDGMGMYLNLRNSTIAYNTIDSTGYSSLVMTGDGNIVERNILSNTGFTKHDLGFVQMWGGNTFNNTIKENICFNGFSNKDGMPEGPKTGYDGNGLYFDDFTHDNLIVGNTVYNSGNGIFVQSSQNMTVRENVTFNCVVNGFSAHEKDPNGYFSESSKGWSRHLTNLTLRKNVFYAFNASQNSIRFASSQCGSDYDFGTSDSNYVFNLYNTTTFMTRFPACGKYPPFDVWSLQRWQAKYNQEWNSKTNSTVYPAFTYTFADSEMIPNGKFDQNVTSWTTYQSGVSATWDGVNGINGGSLKLQNTTTGTGEVSGPKFALVSGKKYLLKFTARTNVFDKMMVAIGRNSPYAMLFSTIFPVDKDGYSGEWLITSNVTEAVAKIQFYTSAGNTLWLDNVTLMEVSGQVADNYDERNKLFVNKTTVEQTMSLGGLSYFDLDGKPVCGSIKLAPYRSKVLIRDYNNGCVAQINCSSTGTILREYWANVSGTTISPTVLTTAPTSSSQLSIFEGPINVAENYQSRIRGYICPPITGDYIFWIAGDDNSELYLSTTDLPSNKRMIANVPGWTTSRDWIKYSSQKSTPIHLNAGTRYYIEALHKEGGGGDNVAVGWQLPNGVQERPIPGSRLSPFVSSSARSFDLESMAHAENAVSVFPNPATHEIQVSGFADNSTIQIIGSDGKIYLSQENSNGTAILPLSEIPGGLYILRIENATQGVVHKKFFKE